MRNLLNVKESNPKYWNDLVERSRYTQQEIESALGNAIALNEELESLKAECWSRLRWEDGEEMTWKTGYPNTHHLLMDGVNSLNSLSFSFSDNGNWQNRLPVRKWEKEIRAQKKAVGRLRKILTSTPKAY